MYDSVMYLTGILSNSVQYQHIFTENEFISAETGC